VSARLAVVIVTWNVRELALEALRSLFADLDAHGPEANVYVVDSASSDGTAEAIGAAFPRVRLTASRENLGFGRANNLGMRQMGFTALTPGTALTPSPSPSGRGEKNKEMRRAVPAQDLPDAVYLLNPDTITQPGATKTLFDTLMADARLGLVGARLTFGDGSFQHSGFGFPGLRQLWTEFFPTPGRFIEGRFNGRYPRALYDAGKPFPVDFVLGATMMLRREVIEQTSGFDEAFFMYCEEIDWAWRIHKAGWEVRCVPAACVTHLAGKSTGQARPQSIINLWTSRMQLYRKHQPAWKVSLARMMIVVGMKRKIREARGRAAGSEAEREAVVEAYSAVVKKVFS
jgi:N-acetylglucosaminyl-diphospho-decaprenol L-rhamnosyltransferase